MATKQKTVTVQCKTWDGSMSDRMAEKYDTACAMCGRLMRTFHSSGVYILVSGRTDANITIKDVSGSEWDDAERVNELECIGAACAKKVPADYKWETAKRL
jgi:hypothetical protein